LPVSRRATSKITLLLLAVAYFASNEPANLLTRNHREAVANLLNG
jgi:hypothetical protein